MPQAERAPSAVPQSPPEPSGQLRVLDVWRETADLVGLRLDLGLLAEGYHRPGQVLRLRSPGPDGAEGYFALASAPSGRAEGGERLLGLAGPSSVARQPGTLGEVLLKRGGPVADAIIEEARPGAALLGAGPLGSGFPVEKIRGRDVLLFAAGSGIAPVRALLSYLQGRPPSPGRIALWYGQRKENEFAFSREHDAWRAAGVHLVLCCSDAGPGWTGARGWVQQVAERDGYAGIDPANATAFLCGMKSMVHGVREHLLRAGLPVEHTHLNY